MNSLTFVFVFVFVFVLLVVFPLGDRAKVNTDPFNKALSVQGGLLTVPPPPGPIVVESSQAHVLNETVYL